jgi:hypothetical protein
VSDQLALLPENLRAESISTREIVLPQKAALEAIEFLEKQGHLILGWEGWVKDSDGRMGHGNAPQGTPSLEGLSVAEAANLCRRTIPLAEENWHRNHPDATASLYFCVTVKR